MLKIVLPWRYDAAMGTVN